MFFTECANLAAKYPNLATAILKIDTQFKKMRTAEVIRVEDLASFLNLDRNQVNAIFDGLAEMEFLCAEDVVECEYCQMAVLKSDYEDVLEEDDEYRCTSCDRLIEEKRAKTVVTYRRGDKWPELPVDSVKKDTEQIAETDVSSRYYCRIITHDELKKIDKNEYENLVSDKKAYDIFIDGFSREVSHKGKIREKLTAAELEIISEYIESKTTMRPFSTKTGGTRSREASIKLIESARKKVDIRLSRYKYLSFQLHKATDPMMKSFLFAPPKDLKYCLILPNSR